MNWRALKNKQIQNNKIHHNTLHLPLLLSATFDGDGIAADTVAAAAMDKFELPPGDSIMVS